MPYLLIVGCSQKKTPSPHPMKAIDRYQGVNFSVIRKFNKELLKNIDILIISAKYGLLKSDDYIQDYNQRMTRERAAELNPHVLTKLRRILSRPYTEIFINLGKDYLPSIQGIEPLTTCPIIYAEGRIGEKMKAMKEWIEKATSTQTTLM